ncbi:MAG TPA: GNAT family N-acetyltransferase [Longimicrobiaceae bacterium]|nr:GNAT family N-acetyltransferase [Longimicrobiaceae bacterium]
MVETFRPVKWDEVGDVARLEAHSFPSTTRGHAWWEKFLVGGPHGGLEALWVAEEGGRLVGACQLLWLRQWIGGVPLRVMGLGSVAIAPTHRRRGLATRMLTAGFEHARERGDVGSALFPFRASYYEQLGYGLAGAAHQYQIPPGVLPDARDERLRMRLVESDAEFAAMRSVYAQGAPQQTGQLERTERSWSGVWNGHDRAAVVYWGEGGEPEGYAIVRYRADLPLTERFLEVEERMWLTLGAQRGLYAWLSSMGDQWRELVYRAHPEEGFGERLSEPRLPLLSAPSWGLWFPSATLLRGPMFRLLDVPAALSLRSVVDSPELTLAIDVEDVQIPENRGPWRVRLEDGATFVEPYTGGYVDATLTLPVDALSRIFIGALAPRQAVAGGLATIDRPEVIRRLDTALHLPRPWTFDRF